MTRLVERDGRISFRRGKRAGWLSVSAGKLAQPTAAAPSHRRDLLRARLRTAILLSIVVDLPVLAAVVRALTREPLAESVEIDGVPAELVRPAGTGPWPAMVFVTGAHPLRRREPIVQRVAEGFARAGFIALVPDLPGLGEGEITPRTLESAIQVVEWMLRREDVRAGRVALAGASAGASLALLVAERRELASSVSLVASVCPFADLEKMICLATTRRYEEEGRLASYDAAILLRRVVARSMLAALPSGRERTELLACVGDILDDDRDPLGDLGDIDTERLAPQTRAVVRLLTNSEPARFRELYDGLPGEVHALVDTLSPLRRAGGVQARVEIAVPPLDPYFPPGEMKALAASLQNARLTVSGTLDHTRPMLSRERLGDFASFGGFVFRTLAGAAS